MPQLSIKQFAQDHTFLVEDVCSRGIYCVDVNTPITSLAFILKDTTIHWVLTTSKDTIIGLISRTTLLQSLHYGDAEFQVGALVECIPDTAHAKDEFLSYGRQWSADTPLRVVQNTEGEVLGVLDKESWNRLSTRHMLTPEDKDLLFSNPIIEQIATVANDFGIEVYIIGGWVRDFILGLPSKDLDFAVVGNALQLATELARQFGGDVHQFNDFGGAHWIVSDTLTIDFTGARSEEYSTLGALPTVTNTHIDIDLQRRDFSINAMAIAIHMNKLGLLLDPMHGLRDLENRQLQTLHGLSFLQDPTRIFRAARYSARFNMRLQSATLMQLQEATSIIQIGEMLSRTRIGIELEKIFDEAHPEQCWHRLNEWNVWATWQPSWSSLFVLPKHILLFLQSRRLATVLVDAITP